MLGLVLLSCGSSKVGRGELNTQLPHDIKKTGDVSLCGLCDCTSDSVEGGGEYLKENN